MRKLLIPALAAALVMGVVVAGTWAWFSDTETSSGNTFTAGGVELLIAALDADESVSGDPGGDDDTFGNFASHTWVISNITPGANAFCTTGTSDCTGGDKVSGKVRLLREGSISPDHLEITAQVSIDENPVESDTVGNSSANEMAQKLRFLTLSWNGNNCFINADDTDGSHCFLADQDGDGVRTLNDLTFDNALDNLKPVPGTVIPIVFHMVLQWAEDTAMPGLGYTRHCGTTSRLCDNAFQGDALTLTMFFTLNQEASQ